MHKSTMNAVEKLYTRIQDWSIAPSWANWRGIDRSGTAYWFSERPSFDMNDGTFVTTHTMHICDGKYKKDVKMQHEVAGKISAGDMAGLGSLGWWATLQMRSSLLSEMVTSDADANTAASFVLDINEIEKKFIQSNHLCQGEVEWVLANKDRYENNLHVKAVIGNIEKLYFMRKTEELVKRFAKTKTTGDMFALFEHFNVTPG